MRITAFIGAAVLGLSKLALAPVAMAGPASDICVLDPSQPMDINAADMTGAALAAGAVPLVVALLFILFRYFRPVHSSHWSTFLWWTFRAPPYI